MNLSDLDLDTDFRSANCDLAKDLLASLLKRSRRYDRAVGFFSSTTFQAAPQEWCNFFERGGTLRLICSPVLAAADIAAIGFALVSPNDAGSLCEGASTWLREGHSAKALAGWLARGKIQLKVAIRTHGFPGIYHEKMGVFGDAFDNIVAITGSLNESYSAWSGNFERADVFTKRGDEESADGRVNGILAAFRNLWLDKTTGVQVVPCHEAYLNNLFVLRPPAPSESRDEPIGLTAVGPPPPEICVPPATKPLRTHQEAAVRAWVGSGGKGILAMATGSGKTLTALHTAARLAAKAKGPLAILIIAPYIHLVDQWIENAREFGLRPIRCAEGAGRWHLELAVAVNCLNSQGRPVLSVAVTQASLLTENFQELIARIRVPLLVIGDEAHNYASLDIWRALPRQTRFRIGLSATPDRPHDPEGTERLRDYFGEVIFRYGLDDAIRDGVLTPYYYFPVRVGLDDDEFERYLGITRHLSRFRDDDDTTNEEARRLLLKRSRVLASARSKLPALRSLLAEARQRTHVLIYCGDGQVEGEVPGEQERQVQAVVRMVGNDLGMTCASYTAATPPQRRSELLDAFATGQIQVLVAIRCLDEGVDVPAARTAFILASSSNGRQFIQRRGRVLRRSPGKESATIYDFMAIPNIDDIGASENVYASVAGLVRRELRRAREFADLAINGPQARATLLDLTAKLGLHMEWASGNASSDEGDRT
jgi:superfamily II DNA or RNA helicase